MSESKSYPTEIVIAIAKTMSADLYVQKKGWNDFHKYKFAAVGDLMAKLQPLMASNGLVIFQTENKVEMLDSGNVLSIQYEFTLAHTSGAVWPERQLLTGLTACRNSKGGFDDKSANKCHTAAEKYFLLGLFKVPTGNEPDADAGDDAQPPSTQERVAEAVAWIKQQTVAAEIHAAHSRNMDWFLSLSKADQEAIQGAEAETLKRIAPASDVSQKAAAGNGAAVVTDPKEAWVNKQIAALPNVTSAQKLEAFLKANADTIAQLAPYQKAPFDKAVQAARTRLTGIQAPSDDRNAPIELDDEIPFR